MCVDVIHLYKLLNFYKVHALEALLVTYLLQHFPIFFQVNVPEVFQTSQFLIRQVDQNDGGKFFDLLFFQ